uniref:Uncharacterized protein n=1 Tax=Rhizophora mucronata TaxID=61149 RepID=A0A2P2MQL4_RHIMU
MNILQVFWQIWLSNYCKHYLYFTGFVVGTGVKALNVVVLLRKVVKVE